MLIITDDQRIGTIDAMRTVRRKLHQRGATYTGIIPTTLCCPSRTAILSGNHSHTTGVWSNRHTTGGWLVFHSSGYEKRTVATALDRSGYATGYFGKYLNNWNHAPKGFAPPGWDKFMAIWEPTSGQGGGAYYNYELRGTEPTETYGNDSDDYSTDVIADKGVRFLRRHHHRPVFLVLSTTGPHHPYRPADRHVGQWTPKEWYHNRAVNEENMSDKPRHIRHKDPVDVDAIHETQERTGQALLSVDQLTRRVLREVNLNRTLVIFMSDNGVMWGEHRLLGKDLPYRWASEVPLFMRWDGTLRRGYHKGVVTNADVGATILAAAGVPDAFPTDGDSVLNGTRKTVVMEGKYSPRHPAFCGSRTKRFLFVEYQNGQRELYDYRRDPLELRNRARNDKYHDIEHQMRDAAKRLCNPPPGSFTWGRN